MSTKTAPAKEIRLQRYLAQAGIASRRRAEEIIAAGRVTVNGTIVTKLGTVVDPKSDRITVDGKVLRREERRLFLLNKPRGVVTTLSDPQGRPTIADYTKHIELRLYPVGRLDFDVSGLLILTNDGDLAYQLMHPKFGSRRKYWARVEGSPSDEDLQTLLRGVMIDGTKAVALAAAVIVPTPRSDQVLGRDRSGRESTLVELEVGEGRKHLVKELFKSIGFPVIHLARIGHGEYNLGDIKPGELRELRPEKNSTPRKDRKSPRKYKAERGRTPSGRTANAGRRGSVSPHERANPLETERRAEGSSGRPDNRRTRVADPARSDSSRAAVSDRPKRPAPAKSGPVKRPVIKKGRNSGSQGGSRGGSRGGFKR